MTPIIVVAQNTFRQTVRQRLFFNVGIFGVGMVLLSMVMGQITFGHPDRVVRSIGLSGVTIATDLIALLTAVSLIHQEIDRKTLFVVLTRPIHRWQYVVGRYLGLLFALFLVLVGFTIIFAFTLSASLGSLTGADILALIAIFPEAAILAAFGMLLSAFSTPTLSAGIGLGFWIAASTTDDLIRLTKTANPFTKAIAQGTYYVFPSLERLNFRDLAVYQKPIVMNDFALAMGYGALYCVALVALASVVLSRREMV